jgi:hypothetical protein
MICIGSIEVQIYRIAIYCLEGLKLLIGGSVLIGADNPIGPNNHIHFPVVISYWHFAVYDLLSEGQCDWDWNIKLGTTVKGYPRT